VVVVQPKELVGVPTGAMVVKPGGGVVTVEVIERLLEALDVEPLVVLESMVLLELLVVLEPLVIVEPSEVEILDDEMLVVVETPEVEVPEVVDVKVPEWIEVELLEVLVIDKVELEDDPAELVDVVIPLESLVFVDELSEVEMLKLLEVETNVPVMLEEVELLVVVMVTDVLELIGMLIEEGTIEIVFIDEPKPRSLGGIRPNEGLPSGVIDVVVVENTLLGKINAMITKAKRVD
jgi:hypothetical protein